MLMRASLRAHETNSPAKLHERNVVEITSARFGVIGLWTSPVTPALCVPSPRPCPPPSLPSRALLAGERSDHPCVTCPIVTAPVIQISLIGIIGPRRSPSAAAEDIVGHPLCRCRDIINLETDWRHFHA